MAQLPITRMKLYKHGVGFIERRATVTGDELELTFRTQEMNDILKSLTVIDLDGGQVLGVEYATPQSRKERLAGCSINLEEHNSLRDLLVSSRGRRVELSLDDGETLTGTPLGIDEPIVSQPWGSMMVSILPDESATVRVVAIEHVKGVEILDERGAADLRFFLQTSLIQDEYSSVTVRLSPGEHDLSVSYIAPAPTWRVSYRLVLDPAAEGGQKALLLGWGIFDNRLEEDLERISLSLVAGMPISFVYDLFYPFTPERPEVQEEERVAPVPSHYKTAMLSERPMAAMRSVACMGEPEFGMPDRTAMRSALADAQTVTAKGEALGELFEYRIETPVTVGRGQSAMVPVVSADLQYRKDLLYNGRKLATHPVATLRMQNVSGLTLERGPVTVLDDGEYVGEAVLPFTAAGGELVIPYAVELGARIYESEGRSNEVRRVFIKDRYLHVEEWDVRWQEYRLSNQTAGPITVLVEHPRSSEYDLFDTKPPEERTDEDLRFEMQAPGWGEVVFIVKERRLRRCHEDVLEQSHEVLQHYLKEGLLDRNVYEEIHKVLKLYDRIGDCGKELQTIKEDREKLYEAQRQVQGNMQALSQTGREGELRARYVEQLEMTDGRLRELEQREVQLKEAGKQLEDEVMASIEALG